MSKIDTKPVRPGVGDSTNRPPAVTVFVCTHSARGGLLPSATHPRPTPPAFEWPFAVREIVIPCGGRLQPEHILKAFEHGCDAVAVIACDESNCHCIEGSRRARRRVEFVRKVLDEIALGSERLLLLHLGGSARQDMVLGAGLSGGTAESPDRSPAESSAGASDPSPGQPPADLPDRLRAVREQIVAAVRNLPPSPLRAPQEPLEDEPDASYELDETDDNEV